MQANLLLKTLLFFLITICIALALQSTSKNKNKGQERPPMTRDKRFFLKKKSKPGFFRTLFSVIYEQYTDTKNTINTVNKLVNDNFASENHPVTPPPTINSDPNASTTTEVYKITRSELNRILRRNVKGLVKLYNIELQDALKASEGNFATLRRNASLEVSKFL